jgi:para-nitrobenzyl esterase
MPYVFGTLDRLQRPWTDIDRKLSDTMMGYWVSFIRTGDPNGNGRPKFPAFAPDRVAVMELGEHVGVREAMSAERFKFWSDVFASPVGARLGPF